MDPRELDYDTIGWAADGDGKIHWTEQHFIGSHFVCDGRVFQVACILDGKILAVVPVEVQWDVYKCPHRVLSFALSEKQGRLTLESRKEQ